MLVRIVVGALLAGSVAGPVLAETLNADEARKFVANKMFAFTCFDGTKGVGNKSDCVLRVDGDGLVAATRDDCLLGSAACAALSFHLSCAQHSHPCILTCLLTAVCVSTYVVTTSCPQERNTRAFL